MKQLVYLRALARVLARRFNPWPSETDDIFSLKPLFCGIYPTILLVVIAALTAAAGGTAPRGVPALILGLQILVAPWWLHWLRNTGVGEYLRDVLDDVEVEAEEIRETQAARSLPPPDPDLSFKSRLEELRERNRRVFEQMERDLIREQAERSLTRRR